MRKGPKQTHIGAVARQIQKQYTGSEESPSRGEASVPQLPRASRVGVEHLVSLEGATVSDYVDQFRDQVPSIAEFCFGFDGKLDAFMSAQLVGMNRLGLPPQAVQMVEMFIGGGVNGVSEFFSSIIRSWVMAHGHFPEPKRVASWEDFLADQLLPLAEFGQDLGMCIRGSMSDCFEPFAFREDEEQTPFVPDRMRPVIKNDFKSRVVGNKTEQQVREILVGKCPAREWTEAFFPVVYEHLMGLYQLLYEDSQSREEGAEEIANFEALMSMAAKNQLFVAEFEAKYADEIAQLLGEGRSFPHNRLKQSAQIEEFKHNLMSFEPLPPIMMRTLIMIVSVSQALKRVRPIKKEKKKH